MVFFPVIKRKSTNIDFQIHKSKLSNFNQVAQGLSLGASIAATVASVMFQQPAFASVTVVHSLLVSEVSRRRLESVHQVEHKYNTTVANFQQQFSIFETKLETITQITTQTQPSQQKYLTKTHLTPIISQLQGIQLKQKKIEIGQLTPLTQQFKELQQQVQSLENLTASLNERITLPSPSTPEPPRKGDRGRVVIFIDEANLYHAASEHAIAIDYAKLFALLKVNSATCKAIVYTATDPSNKKQQAFLSQLRQKGFEIESKQIVRRSDGTVKGNLDVEIALGLVNLIDSYDTAVLVSGDADFISAVKQSQQKGKRVEVASFRPNTSPSLIKVADKYTDLSSLRNRIS